MSTVPDTVDDEICSGCEMPVDDCHRDTCDICGELVDDCTCEGREEEDE